MRLELQELELAELELVTGGCECHGTFVINSCNQETTVNKPPPAPMPQGEKT